MAYDPPLPLPLPTVDAELLLLGEPVPLPLPLPLPLATVAPSGGDLAPTPSIGMTLSGFIMNPLHAG